MVDMKKDEIVEKAKALSSETRLNLIELIDRERHTVSELTKMYESEYNGKTRETIYRELEKLVNASILEKEYKQEIKSFLYSLKSEEIEIKLLKD